MAENYSTTSVIKDTLEYAPLSGRIKACLIDGFIIMVIYAFLLIMLKNQLLVIAEQTKTGMIDEESSILIACLATILCLMIDLWYFVLFTKKHHGTFGQLTQNLRLSLRDGTKASFNAVSLRHIPGFIVLANIFLCAWLFFFLPLQQWMAQIPIYLIAITHGYIFLNLFIIAANDKRKSMSDLWAHTAVINMLSLKEKVDVIFVDVIETENDSALMDVNNKNNQKKESSTITNPDKTVPLSPKDN